jgi:hypothetical protein
VGGAEITFFRAEDPESVPRAMNVQVRPTSVVERNDSGNIQPLAIAVDYPYATPLDATVLVEGLVRTSPNPGQPNVPTVAPLY